MGISLGTTLEGRQEGTLWRTRSRWWAPMPCTPEQSPQHPLVLPGSVLLADCVEQILMHGMIFETQQTAANGTAEIKPGAASKPLQCHRRCPGLRAMKALNS